MIYLCCDTNIWINISNSFEPPRLLDRLYEEIHEENLTLIVPEVILSEWKRNKDTTIIEKITKDTKDQITRLKNLHIFLEKREGLMFGSYSDDSDELNKKPDSATKLRNKIESLIKALKANGEEIISKARKNIELVESIFNHKNTVVLSPDEKTSQFIIGLASNKIFPFESKKNNFADCLIFYQFINYLKNNDLKQGHFVTSNGKDFSPDGELHEQYEKEMKLTDSFFHTSLSEALNKSLNQQLVSVKEFKVMEQIAFAEKMANKDANCGYCGEHISLEQMMDVSDNREADDVEELGLFGNEGTLDALLNWSIDTADSAECYKCGTKHVFCPECRSLWAFCGDKYSINEIQKCSTCGMSFVYHFDDSNKSEMPIDYIELLYCED